MFKHILIAVDFSPAWPLLRQRLEKLTAWGTKRVTLMYVLSTRYPASPQETHRTHYEAKLADLASELATSALSIESQVRSGEPGAVIAEAAQELNADLVLMGCRGYSRWHEFFLGSTALDAARLTQRPLWLEPVTENQGSRDFRLMILATDGSQAVTGAEEMAGKLAAHFQRSLAVAAACASEGCDREIEDAQRHLNTLAEQIEGLETRILDGNPRNVITAEADREAADLVVIGKRGRNRIHEFLLGSTAENIARDAHCPVLVVPSKPE
ncbi:universal stress protein [Vreelandella boliviensis]|nr:universal stress protein [Halomonas boliviensis]EHJ92248.1 Universal stress protein [Halomonas boliviensis LC1]